MPSAQYRRAARVMHNPGPEDVLPKEVWAGRDPYITDEEFEEITCSACRKEQIISYLNNGICPRCDEEKCDV